LHLRGTAALIGRVLIRMMLARPLDVRAADLVARGVRRDPEDVVVVDVRTLPPTAARS
jgi:hypothetical protein